MEYNIAAGDSPLINKKLQIKTNDTGLSDKEIHDLLDASDDEPSNQLVSEENSEELLMDNEDISNEITDDKLSEVHRMLISRCGLDLSGKCRTALGKIFERRISDPEVVLKK